MAFLRNLRLRLRPRRMTDPDFGELVFQPVSNAPERSYWECQWRFPPTGQPVFLSLSGGETGPNEEIRKFYLSLPARFQTILSACRPALEQVSNQWLHQSLSSDVFSDFKLSGFEVEDPGRDPVQWSVSFETAGSTWLGVTIPFDGAAAREPVVDT